MAEPVPRAVPRRLTLVEPGLLLAADAVVAVPLAVIARTLFVGGLVLVALLAWHLRGLHSRRIALSVLDDLPSLAAGVVLAAGPATAAALLVGSVTGTSVVVAAAVLLAGATVARTVVYAVILRQRGAGRLSYPTVVVGAGQPLTSLTERILAHPESGLRLVGVVANQTDGATGPVPLVGRSRQLGTVVRRCHATDVVIGYGGTSSTELVEVLRTCERADVQIHLVPRLYELHHVRATDDHLWGLPLIRMRRPAQRSLTWRLKRGFDIAFAAAALVLTAPVMLALAVAVRRELGPGVLFRQVRTGRGGRPFELLKFRSIPNQQDPTLGPWSVREITIGPVGRFIRRYSLDELPQLLNVLRGDMSVVGPRPERPEYVQVFCAQVPRYVHRHRVPVGMTGLAAVNGLRGDTSIGDRADFDNWYIENWSLWLDLKIVIRTVRAVLRGTGV